MAGEGALTSPQRLKVLIIEDRPDDEELVLLELRRGGYDVVHQRVESEAAMRSALAGASWDVILSDFAMPEFSGPRALSLARGMGLDVPFIIVSGTVGEEAAVSAMRDGANDYVLKGSLARLCPAVAREVREAASRAEQRKMQEQLLISDRMASVGTLAAGVAHEINNPLAAIVANLELINKDVARLAEELDVRERMSDLFEEVRDARESADRLRHIVRDLKIFSRSTDEERRSPVDVKRVMESSLRMAWNEIRHRARLVKDYGEVPPVMGNEARLGQVFLNLVVNAAQAIREGDAEHNLIRVATEVDAAGRVVIEIRDSGSGIPTEHLPHIFDAFYTTKPIGVGTGLGLSICHRIISALGGEIQVGSEVGKGSAFRVLLPPTTAEEELVDRSGPVTPAPRRGRVMVIDDEPAIARAIGRTLDREHDVLLLARGQDALGYVSRGDRFDVILCDLMMPQMTGAELHAALMKEAPDQAAKIVFLTGGAFTTGTREFLDSVPNHRLEKPFETQQLRALVNDRIK